MIDTFFDLLPYAALFSVFFAGLSAYRAALRLRSEPKARKQGLLLNLARRAAPPSVVGVAIGVFGVVSGRADSLWLAGLLIGGGLSYGLTLMLQEMRATTTSVTLFRGLAAAGLSMIVIYLLQLR